MTGRSQEDHVRVWQPEVHVVVPTFHRDARLRDTLGKLADQTRPPTSVVVVDNAARDECRELCRDFDAQRPLVVDYVAAPANIGPAGATALGMERVLERLHEDDLIGRWDDDSPELASTFIERLLDALGGVDDLRQIGGIGPNGACWDAERAQFTQPDGGTGSWVDVDYLATNFMPLFRVGAIRTVGVFRSDLFFGLTEAEFGLRLRSHGFRVLARDRKREPPRGLKANAAMGPTWRSYYSARNRLVLAREYGRPVAPVRVVLQLLLGPILRHWRTPALVLRALRWNLRAIRDALSGNMGRTVEPVRVAGELDLRSTSRPLR